MTEHNPYLNVIQGSTNLFVAGEKVIFRERVYDFGYYIHDGKRAIIYEEGECNMQDALSVFPEQLRKR